MHFFNAVSTMFDVFLWLMKKQSGNKSGEMHETPWDVMYLQKQRTKERTLEVSDLTDVLRPNVHRSPVLLSVMNGAWSMPAISPLKSIGTHCSSAYSLKSKRGGFDLRSWQTNVWLHDQGYVSENTQVFVDVLNKRTYQGLLNSYWECCFCMFLLLLLFFSVYIFNKIPIKFSNVKSLASPKWKQVSSQILDFGRPSGLDGLPFSDQEIGNQTPRGDMNSIQEFFSKPNQVTQSSTKQSPQRQNFPAFWTSQVLGLAGGKEGSHGKSLKKGNTGAKKKPLRTKHKNRKRISHQRAEVE